MTSNIKARQETRREIHLHCEAPKCRLCGQNGYLTSPKKRGPPLTLLVISKRKQIQLNCGFLQKKPSDIAQNSISTVSCCNEKEYRENSPTMSESFLSKLTSACVFQRNLYNDDPFLLKHKYVVRN